jgi:hypothetical protein
MQAALRRGDLAGFGGAFAELGRVLGRNHDVRPVPASSAPPSPPTK